MQAMNTATALLERPSAGPAGEALHLPPLAGPAGRVHTLDCPAGAAALRVIQGRVWLTVEGQPEDHFLSAGQALALHGPARLHLSAEGGRSAQAVLHLVAGTEAHRTR